MLVAAAAPSVINPPGGADPAVSGSGGDQDWSEGRGNSADNGVAAHSGVANGVVNGNHPLERLRQLATLLAAEVRAAGAGMAAVADGNPLERLRQLDTLLAAEMGAAEAGMAAVADGNPLERLLRLDTLLAGAGAAGARTSAGGEGGGEQSWGPETGPGSGRSAWLYLQRLRDRAGLIQSLTSIQQQEVEGNINGGCGGELGGLAPGGLRTTAGPLLRGLLTSQHQPSPLGACPDGVGGSLSSSVSAALAVWAASPAGRAADVFVPVGAGGGGGGWCANPAAAGLGGATLRPQAHGIDMSLLGSSSSSPLALQVLQKHTLHGIYRQAQINGRGGEMQQQQQQQLIGGGLNDRDGRVSLTGERMRGINNNGGGVAAAQQQLSDRHGVFLQRMQERSDLIEGLCSIISTGNGDLRRQQQGHCGREEITSDMGGDGDSGRLGFSMTNGRMMAAVNRTPPLRSRGDLPTQDVPESALSLSNRERTNF